MSTSKRTAVRGVEADTPVVEMDDTQLKEMWKSVVRNTDSKAIRKIIQSERRPDVPWKGHVYDIAGEMRKRDISP